MQLALYFKALADATRLRLLYILYNHELNVNEIVSIMGMGQSRISRHLKILTDCGLLKYRRDGLWVFYHAENEGRGGELLGRLADFIQSDDDLRNDYEQLSNLIEEGYRQRTRFFDSIAPDWNDIKQSIFGEFNISEAIVQKIGSCDVAADLGCGTGELLPYMKNKAAKVIGIDKSPKMLEMAGRRPSLNGKGFELRIGEIEHLPMRDNEANTAVINMVLHHLPSPEKAILEAGRVVKDGGALIIADLDKHRNEQMRTKYSHRWLGFTRKNIERWLSDAGFIVSEFSQFEVRNGLKIDLYVSIKK
jgi:ubiquinone/menaquinone biosynthesis C-methylase UbiE